VQRRDTVEASLARTQRAGSDVGAQFVDAAGSQVLLNGRRTTGDGHDLFDRI